MKKYIGITILFIIAMVVGFFMGSHYVDIKAGKIINNEYINQSATMLKVHIKTLEYFREGNSDKAIELLEKLVDLDLASLGAKEKYIKLYSGNDVYESIYTAKAYRKKYTNHTISENILKSVNIGININK